MIDTEDAGVWNPISSESHVEDAAAVTPSGGPRCVDLLQLRDSISADQTFIDSVKAHLPPLRRFLQPRAQPLSTWDVFVNESAGSTQQICIMSGIKMWQLIKSDCEELWSGYRQRRCKQPSDQQRADEAAAGAEIHSLNSLRSTLKSSDRSRFQPVLLERTWQTEGSSSQL